MKNTSPTVYPPLQRSNGWTNVKDFAKDNGFLFIFLSLWILAASFVPNFLSLDNNVLILKQSAIPIIAAIGMTFVLIIGGIDLSVGYIVGFASMISGILIKTHGFPVPIVILLTLVIGILLGSANGWIVEKIKIPSFIATLGTGYIIFGLAQIISGGNVVNQLPKAFLAFGNAQVLGLPMSVYLSLLIIILFYLLLHKSTFGRALFALGLNRNASFLSGVKVGRYTVLVYTISGTLAAMVGLLLTVRVNSSQPDMGGSSFTFEIITAAVIGGTSLFGGAGKVLGSVFGVLIIKMVENCINLMGVSHYLYEAFMGLVILAAIIFENVKNKTLA
jgi:ribose/xylose/arabinose/galactoside ABC-type transport system permease subunit